MKQNSYILLVIVAYVFLFFFDSCQEPNIYKDADLITYNDFKTHENLSGIDIEFDDMLYKPWQIKIQDSLLFIYNTSTDYIFQVFNINNRRKIGEFISIGNGPNEMLYPTFMQSSDSMIWIFDEYKQEIYAYNKSSFFFQSNPAPDSVIKLKSDYQMTKVALLQGNRLFAMGLNNIQRRFNYFDMEGKMLNYDGKYPLHSEDLTDLEVIQGFACTYVTNFKDRIFVVYYLTDLIDIYNIEGSLLKRIQGIDHFISKVKEVKTGNISTVHPKKGEARKAYTAISNVGNEIFALYSGKDYDDKDDMEDLILVFDWDGKPVRTYKLDKKIFAFAVNPNTKKIYGLSHSPEYKIIEFNY